MTKVSLKGYTNCSKEQEVTQTIFWQRSEANLKTLALLLCRTACGFDVCNPAAVIAA